MAKSKTIRVTEGELEILKKLRAAGMPVAPEAEISPANSAAPAPNTNNSAAFAELAAAIAAAIQSTKGKQKLTVADRVRKTPWMPKDGSPKLETKRQMYQHGILIDSNIVTNDEVKLLDKIRPGRFCEGWVVVTLRKDRGIDIDYPVKTAAQRLKLVNQFGIRSFKELLERLIDEHTNPTNYRRPENLDDFDS